MDQITRNLLSELSDQGYEKMISRVELNISQAATNGDSMQVQDLREELQSMLDFRQVKKTVATRTKKTKKSECVVAGVCPISKKLKQRTRGE